MYLGLVARNEGTGIKALPTSSKPSPWTHEMCSYSSEAARTYAVLRQFPAALKLCDRVLDIRPNDPDAMANKARIYQAQGNLQEAARFLSGINETSPGIAFEAKTSQLQYERNYGELIRLQQARVTQDGFSWVGWVESCFIPVAGWRYGWRKGYR